MHYSVVIRILTSFCFFYVMLVVIVTHVNHPALGLFLIEPGTEGFSLESPSSHFVFNHKNSWIGCKRITFVSNKFWFSLNFKQYLTVDAVTHLGPCSRCVRSRVVPHRPSLVCHRTPSSSRKTKQKEKRRTQSKQSWRQTGRWTH